MKKLLHLIPALALLVLVSACSGGNEEDEARKKEKEQIEEFFNSTKVQFYKGIKIALRSTAVAGKDPEFDKARQTLLRLGGEAISVGAKAVDTNATVNPFELLALAKDLYKAKDVVIKTEEDSLPTLLGNIYYVFSNNQSAEVPQFFGFKYDNNVEHALVGVLWLVSIKGPKEFTMYEMHKTDEDKLGYYDLALLIKLTKSVAYCENNFSWMGMDKASEYIALCESKKSEIIANPPYSFTEGPSSGEQTYYQIHAMGHVMKGLNERQLGKDDEATKDYEIFLSDAEKGGIDNELTWMIGAEVYIRKEDKEKSLMYLSKLEKSTLLDEPEIAAVKEIKGYIEGRENGKALNRISDKLAMTKITYNLLKNRAQKSKQLQQLNDTKEGKRLLELQGQLNEKAAYLEMMNKGLSTDSLGSKAGDLVKGIFGK